MSWDHSGLRRTDLAIGASVDLNRALDTLLVGTLHWLTNNLVFFDPFITHSHSPEPSKVKATLELALLCHYCARVKPSDERLNEAIVLIKAIWQRPDFQQRIVTEPHHVRIYGLIYAALASIGFTDKTYNAALKQLASDGYITSLEEPPYRRLESRYLLDMAGVEHRMEPYEQLYESTLLAKLPSVLYVTDIDAYAITHTIFYMSDFGLQSPHLTSLDKERVAHIVYQLLGNYCRRSNWDLAGELMLAYFCLGGDPINTPIGGACVRGLMQAQQASGAVPAPTSPKTSEGSAMESEMASEFFRRHYHTTLVVALASLIISSAKPTQS